MFVNIEHKRNYRNMSEYIFYYTFQDETGLSKVMLDVNNFKSLRDYFKYIQSETGLNKKQIIDKIGQRADHCFRYASSQWDLPTEETYNELIKVFNIDKYEGFKTYEELRQEYEELRYTFNTFDKDKTTTFLMPPAKKEGHITPKPVDLLEYIIKTSSNEGDVVLDCFMGSGSTGVACLNTKRRFIGIEIEEKYFNISVERLKILRSKLEVYKYFNKGEIENGL